MIDTVPSSGPGGVHFIAIYRCCRDWPIKVGMPVGRCGICGERPEPKNDG